MTRQGFLVGLSITLTACDKRSRQHAADALLMQLPLRTAIFATRLKNDESCLSRNADTPLPAASLAKLLIAVAAAETISRDPRRAALPIRGSERVRSLAASDSIDDRQSYLLADLLYRMVADSDNRAANILIESLGIARINEVAKSLGLRITRVHGYFVDAKHHVVPLAYTTAREMFLLLRAIMIATSDTNLYRRDVYRRLFVALNNQEDRRMIPAGVPSAVIVGNKTGEIDGVLNDAAILNPLDDDPEFIVVLVDGAPPLRRQNDYLSTVHRISLLAGNAYELCR
ncbi:MAG: serine hydrolase [Candidatus Eremiobacteraeota bacterium]|nr:serine hydrolase [Candidatus Eremiobacteraeota bacterium]